LIHVPANILNDQINIENYENILGIDESGKGDFFGPLVIAGVLVDRESVFRLSEMGIRDSKKITDRKISQLANWIMENFNYSVVVIGPEKYNDLYKKIGNLNKLLAWGHSRVIENMAEKHAIDLAVSDKFGKTDLIERALMKNGRDILLHQIVRGEAIIPVAAASILARARFVEYLNRMARQYGLDIVKGASNLVDNAAAKLVKKHGPEILLKTAKVHFKNYNKVMSLI